jgi:ABC-type nitrate/sulfonate/bicarbonate transport system substrate-binding protein
MLVGLLLAFLSIVNAACGGGASDEPEAVARELPPVKRVTFMAGFKAQANLPFVGVYVAQEKGYFAEQRLEVDIRHAQSGEHLQLILAGEIQFSTANGAQVISRNAQGFELVSLALIGQKSEQVFAVAADSNIRTPKDFEGKTFGYPSSVPAEFLAFAKATGIDTNKVNQVRAGFDPRILSEGRVDVLSVFAANEPDTLARQGFQTRIFDPSEYGVASLGLTYITTRELLAKDPDAAGRFLKAALKGLEYANEHRDEAVDIVMKFAPQEDREHQRFMLNTEFDRGALTDLSRRNGIGWQTREQWQALHDALIEFKTIEKAVDVSRIYDDSLLKQAYSNGRVIWP